MTLPLTNLEQATDSAGNALDSAFWYQQGSELANLGSYQEALARFDRAVALQPNDASAWVFRGVTLIHLERYAEALESCDRALALSSSSAEAWLFRGIALYRLGRYQQAYASYSRATGDRPSEPLGQRGMRKVQQIWKRLWSRVGKIEFS